MARRRKPVPPPYEQVEDMLYGMAWKWSRIHHGDLDDLFSLANAVYLDRTGKWDGTRQFEPELRYYVWSAFSMRHRDLARRRRLAPVDFDTDPDQIPVMFSSFSVGTFCDGLSDDAAAVVRLVFDSPAELVADLRRIGGVEKQGDKGGRWWGRTRGHPAHGCKQAIRRYLVKQRGWQDKQVSESFRAVAEALA